MIPLFIIIIVLVIFSFVIKTQKPKTKGTSKKSATRNHNNTSSNYTNQSNIINSNNFSEQRKAESNYILAVQQYEAILSKYDFCVYNISNFERIYCINNSFIVYIGVDTWNGYENAKDHIFPHVLIEELTYNNLFKFNATKFGEIFQEPFYDLKVNRFYGLKNKYMLSELGGTKFFEINEKLPELHIFEKAKKWEGIACHFIIVELYDEFGSAATIKYITNENLEREAQAFCRTIERLNLKYDPINKITNKDILEKLNAIKKRFFDKKKSDKKLIWTLRGHLRYFFISERTTDFDLQNRGADILSNYNNGKYENIKWLEYGRFDGKWKSELLVFEYCKNIYGKENVLYQYSPSFLGKMSYDIFIIPNNTAIEYQGQQHFKPVDFFGGIEHFNKQVERDKKKQVLSKENGVKLVYINYNEIISESLIKERVEK